MNILADTHILIWTLDKSSPLSLEQKSLIKDPNNRVFASQISFLELAIKKNLNKLPDFVPDIDEVAEQWIQNGFEILDITNAQIFRYQHLPLFAEHRDPFDRLLIAIALVEGAVIMTNDAKFHLYSSLINII